MLCENPPPIFWFKKGGGGGLIRDDANFHNYDKTTNRKMERNLPMRQKLSAKHQDLRI